MPKGTITVKVLKPVETSVSVSLTKVDLKEYFKTRKGLWVSEDFEERTLSKAEAIEPKDLTIESWKALRSSSDEDVEAALGEGHVFSESEACALIASLIDKQPKGEAGMLLNDGDYNIFYTPSFVVALYWHSYGAEWSLYSWNRGSDWSGSDRVFSPATKA